MPKTRIALVALLGGALGLLSAHENTVTAQSQGGKITLAIEGFKSNEGQAVISVYNSDDSFLEMDEAVKTIKRPIAGKTMTVVVEGLAAGTYAIGVLHDEDKNGKLKQWLGFGPPKEGVGMSRNPDGFPKFDKCKFKLEAKDQTLPIKVRYLGSGGD